MKVWTLPCHEYANNLSLLEDGEKLGRPILSPPRQDKASTLCRWLSGWRQTRLVHYFPTYSWQGKVGCVLHRRLTICTTVFSHPITFWTSFSPPLISNFMFYAYSGQGNWRLAEFFPTPLTIFTTVSPDVITLCISLMFNLVRVGKELAGPVFPHPLKSKGYICIHDRVRLVEFFCRWLTICTTVFPHPITFWTRLMFNLVRVGKEWADPVFPHPLTSNFRFYAYSWQGKVGFVFPQTINHLHNSFHQPDNLLNKVDV